MASIAYDGSVEVTTNRKKFSVVSATTKEEVSINWRVENFKESVEIALERKNEVVGKIRFSVGEGSKTGRIGRINDYYWGLREPALAWTLETRERIVEGTTSRTIFLKLSADVETTYRRRRDHAYDNYEDKEGRPQMSHDLLSRLSADIRVGDQIVRSFGPKGNAGALNNVTSGYWGWHIFDMLDVDKYLDTDGSLTLELLATTYVTGGETLTALGDEVVSEGKLVEKCRENLLRGVTSLLGDEKTSDITIVVVNDDKELKELGKFFCHTLILSMRCPGFLAEFDGDDEVERAVKVEGVSVEVMEQFLNFLYTGRLKDKRKDCYDDPVWVKLLPQLVAVAVKYDVEDLKEFCDVNFHRAVTRDNALEMFKLAKRYELSQALAKLQHDFSKNIHLLLDLVCK